MRFQEQVEKDVLIPSSSLSPSDYLEFFYDEIALNGSAGITLSELFAKFSPVPDAALQLFLFEMLKQQLRKDDQHLFCHYETRLRQSKPSKQPKLSLSKKKKIEHDEEDDEANTEQVGEKRKKPRKKEEFEYTVAAIGSKEIVFEDAIATYAQPQTTNRVMKWTVSESRQLRALGLITEDLLEAKCNNPARKKELTTKPPALEVLQHIARARVNGVTTLSLTETLFDGDARKLHHYLDQLVTLNLVEKRILQLSELNIRRFNILHLKRFASHFQPQMFHPNAVFENVCSRETSRLKEIQQIEDLMKINNVTSMVLADVGRVLGFGKRHQENLRNYISSEERNFSSKCRLRAFTAECTGGGRSIGRRLWCVRILDESERIDLETQVLEEKKSCLGLMEMGIVHQAYNFVNSSKDYGATIPEVRRVLKIPNAKQGYKLGQTLISKYPISVDKVIVGKNTTFRMFTNNNMNTKVSGVAPEVKFPVKDEKQSSCKTPVKAESNSSFSKIKESVTKIKSEQTSDIKKRKGGYRSLSDTIGDKILESATCSHRIGHIMSRLQTEKIVPISSLRKSIYQAELEASNNSDKKIVGQICHKSVTRLIQKLHQDEKASLTDILLPRINSTKQRSLKCAALFGVERDVKEVQFFLQKRMKEERNQPKPITELQSPGLTSDLVQQRNLNDLKKSDEMIEYQRKLFLQHRHRIDKLLSQARRIGYPYGIMFRTRELHLFLFRKSNYTNGDFSHEAMTFSFQELFSKMTVYEYITILGLYSSLTQEEEEVIVKHMKNQKSNPEDAKNHLVTSLPVELQQKLRTNEFQRIGRMISLLVNLKLIKWNSEAKQNILVHSININSNKNSDNPIVDPHSRLSKMGDGYVLELNAKIELMKEDISQGQPTDLLNFNDKGELSSINIKECVVNGKRIFPENIIPLNYDFKEAGSLEQYWQSLKYLALDSGEAGKNSLLKPAKGNNDSIAGLRGVKVNVRLKYIKMAKMYCVQAWMSSLRSKYKVDDKKKRSIIKKKTKKLKKPPMKEKKKPPNSGKSKKRKIPSTKGSSNLKNDDHKNDGEVFKGPKRATGNVNTGGYFSKEEDDILINSYISELGENVTCVIPNELRVSGSQSTVIRYFKNNFSNQIATSWVVISKKLNKTANVIKRRFNQLIQNPYILLRLKKEEMRLINQSSFNCTMGNNSMYEEEASIHRNPRYSALLVRAIQIMLEPDNEYYTSAADNILGKFASSEIQLVFRYLWLRGWIVKVNDYKLSTTARYQNHSRMNRRGYCFSKRFLDVFKLNSPNLPLRLFEEANEHSSFLSCKIEEETDNAEEVSSASTPQKSSPQLVSPVPSPFHIDYDYVSNALPGFQAVELSTIVINSSKFIAKYTPRGPTINNTPHKSNRNLSENPRRAGFAAHAFKLSKGIEVKDILHHWIVKIERFNHVLHSSENSSSLRMYEAFSQSHLEKWKMPYCVQPSGTGKSTKKKRGQKKRKSYQEDFENLVINLIESAKDTGVSKGDLLCLLEKEHNKAPWIAEYMKDCQATCLTGILKEALALLTNQKKKILLVCGYDKFLYVSKSWSDIWTIKKYDVRKKVVDANQRDKPCDSEHEVSLVYGEEDVVAYSWVKLDGKLNSRFLVSLKRKLVTLVLSHPGICDSQLHGQMNSSLSLCEIYLVLSKLVADRVLYVRILPKPQKSISLFGGRTCEDIRAQPMGLESWEIDRQKYIVRYFPSVLCIQQFGNTIQDENYGIM